MISEIAQGEQEFAKRVLQNDAHVAPKPRAAHGLAVKKKVEVTAKEREVFDTLLATVERFGLGTQLRVAGGWVRDKLIGRDCYDIDIALDNIMGREFAEKVNEYLHEHGQEARGVGVIQKNPEQSKHLETATMMIHGVWIDLVNLRAEEYADGSRIPTAMEFGTAEQDALRRDLTINSLFYNITTDTIEDLTGHGINDLQEGIVRTPLPAHQTFLDDPLRVLRAVRFAARFGFDMSEDIPEAARNIEVQKALVEKVSRERVGKELELMMKSSYPSAAVSSLVDLCLFPIIFHIPSHILATLPPDWSRVSLECIRQSEALVNSWKEHLPASLQEPGTDQLVSLHFAAALLPLRDLTLTVKKRQVPLSSDIILHGLKLKKSTAEAVSLLHAAASDFKAILPLLQPSDAALPAGGHPLEQAPSLTLVSVSVPLFAVNPRVLAGLLLRKAEAAWTSALLICACLGIERGRGSGGGVISRGIGDRGGGEAEEGGEGMSEGKRMKRCSEEVGSLAEGHGDAVNGAEYLAGSCLEAIQQIRAMGLDGVWQQKPLLNGREVTQLLGLKQGDKRTGALINRVVEWQLANPSGSVEDLKHWLQSYET